jgi:hypothetical protein
VLVADAPEEPLPYEAEYQAILLKSRGGTIEAGARAGVRDAAEAAGTPVNVEGMTRAGLNALIAVAQAELARAGRREEIENEHDEAVAGAGAAPATPECAAPMPAAVARKRARTR